MLVKRGLWLRPFSVVQICFWIYDFLEFMGLNMTDLEMIKQLEQHAGFVLNRLTCDGNVYAKAINLELCNRVFAEFCSVFAHLRGCLTNINPDELSRAEVAKSIDSFDTTDWQD